MYVASCIIFSSLPFAVCPADDPDTLARQLPVAVPSTPRGGGGGAGSGGGGVDLSSSSEMAGGGGGTGASDEDEDARLAMRGGRCACCMGFCARAKTILAIDQTLLLLMLVAGVMALVGWLAFPDSTWLGSEFYRWPTMFLASCVFFTVAKFAEWLFVWLISFSIATFVWKIYFYLVRAAAWRDLSWRCVLCVVVAAAAAPAADCCGRASLLLLTPLALIAERGARVGALDSAAQFHLLGPQSRLHLIRQQRQHLVAGALLSLVVVAVVIRCPVLRAGWWLRWCCGWATCCGPCS